ncbi:MAG TPA: UBP-type zinc finger domain-containing protein [Solirubrobacterales bacterium]|nr:UBP-type zinc finger domain-containing protein [Solirubrobacterales bacterium]
MPTCTHIDSVQYFDPPAEIEGCEECLRLGMTWVHLRMCQECGRIGCCDNSEGKHATAHSHESGHPLIRSVEPGEDWTWCYVDEAMFRLSRG